MRGAHGGRRDPFLRLGLGPGGKGFRGRGRLLRGRGELLGEEEVLLPGLLLGLLGGFHGGPLLLPGLEGHGLRLLRQEDLFLL